MAKTYLTIAEKTSERHREKYILHNGWQWYHTTTNIENHMKELLIFFECTIELEDTTYTADNGKKEFYNVSKEIISTCNGGFWTINQMIEKANGRRIKSFIGLSNGKLTTCYACFDDDNNTVEILRPNPNAKEVYCTLPLKADIEYRKNHWFL